MSGFSDYLESNLLDHVFGASAFAAPGTLYVGLSTTAPNDDGTGVTEPGAGAYARVAVTNNLTNWPAATPGDPSTKSNGTKFTFPTATASWGVITHFVIYDAGAGGNLIASGALTASKTIDSGDQPFFDPGELDITLQ